ncbi:MAG: flagellin [Agathobacter rectalis]
MKINRNMSAVRANKQLLGTENRLSKSMKRLSSGYKINSAEDNPAGMAISNKMKAQIEALDQAKSNSSDAQNVMKIADGALGEVSSMLQRIRELAVQGASDTYSENDKKALQSEIDELTKEVDRISGDTEYNTKSLLDGSSDTRVYVRRRMQTAI